LPASLLPLIPGLPLLGGALLVVLNRRAGRALSALIAALTVGGAAALAALSLRGLADGESLELTLFTWVRGGRFAADAGLVVDPTAGLFLCASLLSGLLMLVFAAGYLDEADDASELWRWYAAACLTLGASALLLTADNLLLLYAGWEGVGIGAALLIGFRGSKEARGAAGRRAFIVDRLSGALLLLGIAGLLRDLGGVALVDFSTLEQTAKYHPVVAGGGSVVALCFVGAAAVRAGLFPLQSWLVGGAEGPAPTAGILHGAVGVTSALYLLIRVRFALNDAELVIASDKLTATAVAVVIGGLTAVLMAVSAAVQQDLRRALAALAASHAGLALAVAGLGGDPAILEVIVLVQVASLGAMVLAGGSASHAQDGEVDPRRMGGLRSFMPLTALVFALGWAGSLLAAGLAGLAAPQADAVSPFGPWTAATGQGIWLLTVAAGTYASARLLKLIFLGDFRGERATPHESPAVMLLPGLAAGAGVAGAAYSASLVVRHSESAAPLLLSAGVLFGAAAVIGLIAAAVDPLSGRGGLAEGARRLWYTDALLDRLVVGPLRFLARYALRPLVDDGVIGGGATLLARGAAALGRLQDRLALDGAGSDPPAAPGSTLPVVIAAGAALVVLLCVAA